MSDPIDFVPNFDDINSGGSISEGQLIKNFMKATRQTCGVPTENAYGLIETPKSTISSENAINSALRFFAFTHSKNDTIDRATYNAAKTEIQAAVKITEDGHVQTVESSKVEAVKLAYFFLNVHNHYNDCKGASQLGRLGLQTVKSN